LYTRDSTVEFEYYSGASDPSSGEEDNPVIFKLFYRPNTNTIYTRYAKNKAKTL